MKKDSQNKPLPCRPALFFKALNDAFANHCRCKPKQKQLHIAEPGLSWQQDAQPTEHPKKNKGNIHVEIRDFLYAKAHHLPQNNGIINGIVTQVKEQNDTTQHNGGQYQSPKPRKRAFFIGGVLHRNSSLST
ncbi:MAG: hypothetical protein J6A48_06235 [Clostridia bacterium]|nr:hypothetical protein [Clostridia bacterium]